MKENLTKNTLKSEQAEKKTPSKFQSVASTFRALLFGDVLRKDKFIDLLPFILFITFLTFGYITNSYYAENTVRAIDKTTTELKELSSEYISIKSELMFQSKPSEVAKMVEGMGIKESLVPPVKIEIKENN